jgi:hypothetical protein
MMTHKHFESIAAVFSDHINAWGIDTNEAARINAIVGAIAMDLAFEFQQENPNFDGDRFLKAAGVYKA